MKSFSIVRIPHSITRYLKKSDAHQEKIDSNSELKKAQVRPRT